MSTRIFYAPLSQETPATIIIPGIPFALTMMKTTDENTKLSPVLDIIDFLKEHGRHFSDDNYDAAEIDWVNGKSRFTLTTNIQNMTVNIIHADRELMDADDFNTIDEYKLTPPISGDNFCKQLLIEIRLAFNQLMTAWYPDDKESQEILNNRLKEAEHEYAATL